VTQDLASSLRALDAEPLAGRSGVELASRRAEAFDLAITAGLAPLEGMALVAIGGYGRSEMAPGSDIDLLLVHEPGLEAGAEEVFAGVLYPLWNAGIRVGHSVRTVEQCRAESMAHLDALTALLDARLLAGEPALAEQARTAAAGIVHEDPAEFVDGLRMWRIERRARAGALAESQEPDLKEALGGLRDLHLLGWLAALEAHELLRPSERRWAGAALDYFLLVRTALHRRAAGSSNSVVADQQPAIADALGVVGEESWESRDVLMRTLFEHGRRANAVATAVLERAARAVGSTSRHELHAEATEAVLLSAFELFARVAHEGGMPAVEELDRVEALVPSEPPATWPPGSVEAFVTMLASGEGGVEALEWLDALGFLPAVLPRVAGGAGPAAARPLPSLPRGRAPASHRGGDGAAPVPAGRTVRRGGRRADRGRSGAPLRRGAARHRRRSAEGRTSWRASASRPARCGGSGWTKPWRMTCCSWSASTYFSPTPRPDGTSRTRTSSSGWRPGSGTHAAWPCCTS